MYNNVGLMGRLTRDPEIRYLQGSNNTVARFTLAVERDYKAANEEQAKTDFINCIAWGKVAEFIGKYFTQGSLILADGRIETGSYTNKDGQKVYTTEVNVSKVYFTGEKREATELPERIPEGADGFMNIPDGLPDEGFPFN